MAYAPNPHRKVKPKKAALRCASAPCTKTTTSPTGRCFWHRSDRPGAVTPPLYVPAPEPAREPGWVSGRGVEHSTGGYDTVKKTGGKTVYTRHGKLHRLDGPAEVSVKTSGMSIELYYVQGELHREDGPAVVGYNDDGSVYFVKWYDSGKPHREGAPSETYFYRDGTTNSEGYTVRGESHRLDGPAIISYDTDGKIRENGASYYVNDEQWTPEAHARLAEALADGAPFEWARAFAGGPDE